MRRWWLDLGSFAVALALAAAVVLRWRRGHVALLSSTAAPAIRLLALLIVFVQGCADRLRGREEPDGQGAVPGSQDMSVGAGPSQQVEEDMSQGANAPESSGTTPTLGPDAFPLADEAALGRWARLVADDGFAVGPGKRFALALVPVPEATPAQDPRWLQVASALEALADAAGGAEGEAFRSRWRAHVEARKAGGSETIAELQALLSSMEALPLYHAGLAGYVWRRAAPLPVSASERAELFGRIERHLRACEALLKGQFETGPIEFTAWRSKAAPPVGYSGLKVPKGLLAAAKGHYPQIDAGTWTVEATLSLTVVDAGVTLLRAGRASELQAGQRFTLGRLDVLASGRPAKLRHDELGDMSLGAGAVVTAWDVGQRLARPGSERVRAKVAAAQSDDSKALEQLQSILPAAHLEIRRALAEKPQAPGSPGLRTLLELFDQ
ncbi:hypothetical protein OV203_35225 [Nannocystis sp. ILAH1]|uniref:hypothetical protein n=1 Tax=unclassified Nannocystis TaxID=2627009 RepID=UPI002271779F|nr:MULTISPECIES: hypothetical protein [unclassified Nannocystis]MCY0992445.1 hypothetical protein [Nannocystis sp. ILAH1]MCY1068964.1 hypothetical protein [Nannocystis sp. RBIL2]